MNPLDIVLAGLFEMLGYTEKGQQPIKIDAKGQTSTTSKSGKLRDFTKPGVAANRQPTLDPLPQRSNLQATPPKPPAGGFGQSPGQLDMFEQNKKIVDAAKTLKRGNNPTSSISNNIWYQLRKLGLKGPTGGGLRTPTMTGTQGKALGIELGLVGINRLLASIPGIDPQVKQRLDQAVRDMVPGGEILAPQPEKYGPPDSLNVPPAAPVTPVQEPIKPAPWSPDNNFGTANPKDTFKPKPVKSEAPINSNNRSRISRYDNLGVESVSPNRGDLRPNVFAR